MSIDASTAAERLISGLDGRAIDAPSFRRRVSVQDRFLPCGHRTGHTPADMGKRESASWDDGCLPDRRDRGCPDSDAGERDPRALARSRTSSGLLRRNRVQSPNLDALAASGIRFADAHATAPLCSPARGSLFTGQYPHHNGLVGLAHHGFAYRPGTRTLPAILSDAGYRSVLFGMQHESTDPTSIGFDTIDVSDSRCDHVVAESQAWLRRYVDAGSDRPFLLTAGFFETHRPYPADEYDPADPTTFDVPEFLPDTADVRDDLAGLHGSITKADAAVGRLLATVERSGWRRAPGSSSSPTTASPSPAPSRRSTPRGPEWH